jgi:hypothetical protein
MLGEGSLDRHQNRCELAILLQQLKERVKITPA